jgi:putative ABC transport system permease protein
MNLPVLFFSLAVSLIAGVLSGCAPAWQSSRWNLSDALKQNGGTAGVSGHQGLRRSLVVSEFALALALLAGAGLALHSFWKMTRANLGFRQDHILTFNLALPTNRFKNTEQTTSFYRQLLDKIHALPGVRTVSASTGMPVVGTSYGLSFSLVGGPPADPTSRPGAGFTMVTPEYFRTFGIEVIKGRSFTEQDVAGALPVAIVNETFAKKYLANVDPLTQRLAIDHLVWGAPALGPPINWQIVGIYRDVRNDNVRREDFPEINVPFWQSPWPEAAIEVRTAGDPASMSESVTAAVQSVNPDLGIDSMRTMDQVVEQSFAGDRFVTIFLATFAAMALLLAGIGIYGVMSFAMAQRTREIGLRMALGAGRAQVLRLVLREGVSLAIAGLFIGLCGTYFVGRAMKSILFEVSAADPATIAFVSSVLLLSALFACYIPGRRATRVDPMVALRNE